MKHSLLITTLLLTSATFAQNDSIFDQGEWRHYIVHLPSGYSSAVDYPVVLNFHGLGSNKEEQQLYSAMDAAADTYGFIVVYPDGIDNQWNFGQTSGPDDTQFALALLDEIRLDYSTNSCWFSTGMSMGGFLTYKIACTPTNAHDLPTAIAVVTGNMLTFLQQTSSNLETVPVMHFHGTNDGTVNYNGSTGVSSVENTVAWWANENNCSNGPVTEAMPNVSTTDNSTVDRITYSGGDEGSQVILYRVNGGGHTWPGAIDVPPLGVTNHDINATDLIAQFFMSYCGTADLAENGTQPLEVFPNPSNGTFTVTLPENAGITAISLTDLSGRVIESHPVSAPGEITIATSQADGTYALTANGANGVVYRTSVVISH
jgi:polyhydroxybutyrate depolymerase